MNLRLSEAVKLLEKYKLPKIAIDHSILVAKIVRILGEILKERGYPVDVDSAEIGALLHDIGRSVSWGVDHCYHGYRILKTEAPGYENYALRHVGAGLSHEEAGSLGLPEDLNYMPQTLEEKLVAYADNIVYADKFMGPDRCEERFKRELGGNHPGYIRIVNLNRFFERIIGREELHRVFDLFKNRRAEQR